MARAPLNAEAFDRSEYDRADQHFKLAKQKLPPPAVEALAREVVKRLAFRMPRSARKEDLPTQSEIDLLCAALLSADHDAADRIILAARRDGVDIEAIYLSYVAGAARSLGVMWDEDRISFVDVTLASGRLYRIIRGLRHIVAASLTEGRDERPALFALVPGEDHTLGIEMATDLFRREGWDVDMSVGLTHDQLLHQSEERNYRAVVLVAHSDRMIEPLARLILALRITQPLANIIVAGNVLIHFPDIIHLVGADAVMDDIETAAATLRAVLDENAS